MLEEELSQPYVVAAAIAIFRHGRVLALRRAASRAAAPGAWETVSGRVRPDEEPAATALREVEEESGLAIRLDPRPVTAYAALRAGAPMIVIVYRAESATEAPVRRSEEHDADAWLTPDAFAAACPFEPLVQAVYQASRLDAAP